MMNHLIHTTIKYTLLTVFALGHASNISSGLHIGGQIGYHNSAVEVNMTDEFEITQDGIIIDDESYLSSGSVVATGFASGVVAGYRLLKNSLYIDASLALFAVNGRDHILIETIVGAGAPIVDPLAPIAGPGAATGTAYKANYFIYPTVTVGYAVNNESIIGLKAGYGHEKWEYLASRQGQEFDSNGWLVGAEILTAIRSNMSIGLNAIYSKIDKSKAYTDTVVETTSPEGVTPVEIETTSTSIFAEPETTTVSITFEYSPSHK